MTTCLKNPTLICSPATVGTPCRCSRRERYANADVTGETGGRLTEDMIRQIVEAVSQLDVVQWAKARMEAEQSMGSLPMAEPGADDAQESKEPRQQRLRFAKRVVDHATRHGLTYAQARIACGGDRGLPRHRQIQRYAEAFNCGSRKAEAAIGG
jgi:hypothetical protein